MPLPSGPSPTLDEILDPTFDPSSMDHGGYVDPINTPDPDADEDVNGGADRIIGDEEPAAPAAAPQPAAIPATPAAPAAPGAPALADAPAPNEPFWYRRALKEKDERTRQLEARLQQLERQQPAREAAPTIDPIADPEAFQQQLNQRVGQSAFELRLEFSEIRAREKFTDAVWEEANDWLATRPDVGRAAAAQRDPCVWAVQEYQRQKLAAEIGDNPEAWRQAERERIRQEILAESQQTDPRTDNAAPATPGALRPPARAQARIPGPAGQGRSAGPASGRETPRYAGPAPLDALTKNKDW